MKKSLTITAVGLILLIGLFVSVHYTGKSFVNNMIKNAKRPLPAVTIVTATTSNWRPFIASTGQLKALQGITLQPEVPGIIDKIHAHSGQDVSKGDIILSLRHHVESAQLQGAKATLLNDALNYARNKKVYETNKLVSKTVLDDAKAKVAADKAQAAQIMAKINQKIIRAPFSGKLGIITVHTGQFISNQTQIASLQTQTPIQVNYTLPEQDISLIHLRQPVEITTDTFNATIFHGKITAIDSAINDQTKSIAVQATINNIDPKHRLIPGMFVTVHTLLPHVANTVVIPQIAVNYTLYGDSVFKVVPKTKTNPRHVQLHYITLGEKRGDKVAVLKGIKAGDRIISAGQMKLQNGTEI